MQYELHYSHAIESLFIVNSAQGGSTRENEERWAPAGAWGDGKADEGDEISRLACGRENPGPDTCLVEGHLIDLDLSLLILISFSSFILLLVDTSLLGPNDAVFSS